MDNPHPKPPPPPSTPQLQPAATLWKSRWQEPSWRTTILVSVLLVLCPWLALALHAYGLAPFGSAAIRPWDFMVIMCAVYGVIIFLILGAVGVLIPALQQKGLLLIVAALLTAGSIVASTKAIHSLRRSVFTRLADRSMPIVDAIKKYQADKGAPPLELRALVPGYLTSIPRTGIGMYPEYAYSVGSTNTNDPWVLYVPTTMFIMNWDRLIYLPSEKYPERGWGGVLEPMGRWAYVHE